MSALLCRLLATALAVLSLASSSAAAAQKCADPSRLDPIIIANSTLLYGRPNLSDSVWHDDTWAFREHGRLSRLNLYKAWFYDGEWHDPGEFKGIQAGYGRYYFTDDKQLLFGAKRPHFPLTCTLYRTEYFVRAEVQWDDIMRYMNFTTNLGRSCAWGFPDVANVTKAVAEAPTPTAYIAALRGYEGKPLPPHLGGHKKRYIVQLGFVWAALNCSPVEDQQSPTLQGAASGTTAAAPAPAAAAARFVPGSAGSSYSPAPPRVNSHWHNLTTDTAWKSSSAEQYPA